MKGMESMFNKNNHPILKEFPHLIYFRTLSKSLIKQEADQRSIANSVCFMRSIYFFIQGSQTLSS